MPILRGNGRGLRVRFGPSTLSRVIKPSEGLIEDTILGLLEPGKVFYDVGANIGWYSLLAARAGARVIAFEPGEENIRLLRQNAISNDLDVTIVECAVSDQDGYATFLEKGSLMGRLDKDDDPAQAERRQRHGHHVSATREVPVVSLDAWDGPAPSVVKLDVEGGEIGALRGMTRLLTAVRPTLIVELHGTREAVLDALDEHGYAHRPIEMDVPSRECPWWAHILATPPTDRYRPEFARIPRRR
jgi:FkbM family methyltransferase